MGAAGSAVRSALAAPRALVMAAALDRARGRSNVWAATIEAETARRRSAQREPIVRDATAARLIATATLAVRRKKKQRVAQRRTGELARARAGPTSLRDGGRYVTLGARWRGPEGMRRTSRRKVRSIGFVREVSESGPAPSVFQGKYEGKAVPKTSEPGGAKRGNG